MNVPLKIPYRCPLDALLADVDAINDAAWALLDEYWGTITPTTDGDT